MFPDADVFSVGAKQAVAIVDEEKQQAAQATGIAPEQFKGIH
jgi:hypothetical protein